MILRKPYKFLIRNFRLIHFILTLFTVYLVYRTNKILGFFNEYLQSTSLISKFNLTDMLFNSLMFIIPIIVIIGIGIIIYLLHFKEKPVRFYIFNIIIYIFTLIFYISIYSTCKTLETGVADIRVLKAIDDITLLLFVFQTISAIFFTIRALGFDLKKFGFGKDLELDVSEKDNEEFEFDVSFNFNKTKRNVRKNLRSIRYTYKENKFTINVAILLTILITGVLTYLNFKVFNKVYKIGDSFNYYQTVIKTENAYITNKDYRNKKITDNYLVAIKFKALNNLDDDTINPERFVLDINGFKFNHTLKYSDALVDIGETYKKQMLRKGRESEYLFVYEIPEEYRNKKMVLKYLNNSNKYINVKFVPKEIKTESEKLVKNLGNELVITNELVDKLTLKLFSYKISSRMKADYTFEVGNKLYYSYEYIDPDYSDSYEKTILRLKGDMILENKKTNKTFKDMANLIYYYGSIEYDINGAKKVMDKPIKAVQPTNFDADKYVYLQVYKEIEKADTITLILNIRNNVYKYKIK